MQKPKQPNPQKTPQLHQKPTLPTPTLPSPTVPSTLNPWTNKPKIRGQGLLNSIMNKYLNDDEDEDEGEEGHMGRERRRRREGKGDGEDSWFYSKEVSEEEKEYLRIAEIIRRRDLVVNRIEESMKPIFQLQARCAKIDQLLQYLQKLHNRTSSQSQPTPASIPTLSSSSTTTTSPAPNLKPIDTNFIYLPLHSTTTFHQILSQSINRDRIKGIGEYRNMKLKGKIQEIQEVMRGDLCGMLDRSIL